MGGGIAKTARASFEQQRQLHLLMEEVEDVVPMALMVLVGPEASVQASY